MTTVSPTTEKKLRDAIQRLLAGRSKRTDGRLTKANLHIEAGVSRATMNRATSSSQTGTPPPAHNVLRETPSSLSYRRRSLNSRRVSRGCANTTATSNAGTGPLSL